MSQDELLLCKKCKENEILGPEKICVSIVDEDADEIFQQLFEVYRDSKHDFVREIAQFLNRSSEKLEK